MNYSVCSDLNGFINFHKNIKCVTKKNKSLSISKYIFEIHIAATGNDTTKTNTIINDLNKRQDTHISTCLQIAPSIFIKYNGPIRVSRQGKLQEIFCFYSIKVLIQTVPFIATNNISLLIIDNIDIFKCPADYVGFLPVLLPPIISLSKKSARLKLTPKGMKNKLIPSSILTMTHEANRSKDIKNILKKAQLIDNIFISDECEYCGIKQHTEAALNENQLFIICSNCIDQNEMISGKVKLPTNNMIDAYSAKFPQFSNEMETVFLSSSKSITNNDYNTIGNIGICDNVQNHWDILTNIEMATMFKKCKLIINFLKII